MPLRSGVVAPLAVVLVTALLASPILAQCELDRESFDDTGTFGTFVPGDPLALSADGSTLVVAAENDDELGLSAGAVYVLARSGDDWAVETKLTAPDAGTNDQFGRSAALSADGGTLLVGAWLVDDDGTDAGAAYVYSRNGSSWSLVTKLRAFALEARDNFGITVALSASGDVALIGAPDSNLGNDTGGAAYVFNRVGNEWVESARLTAPDAEEGARFGQSVDLSDDGTIALIGADVASLAYVFETQSLGSWGFAQRLESGGFPSSFGFTVSLSGDGRAAAVGAPFTFHEEGVGSVFVFRRDEGPFDLEVELRDPESGIESSFGFGIDLATDGDVLLVGQVLTFDRTSPGSAFVFTRNSGVWSRSQALHAGDPYALLTYGNRVAISSDGRVAVVGSQIGVDPRIAHVYSLSELCPVLVQLPPNPGRAGQVNTLSATWPIAGDRVTFLGARDIGSTPVPGCPGVDVALEAPVLLGEGVATDRGGVTIEIDIPGAFEGERVQIQAISRDRCVVSEPIEALL